MTLPWKTVWITGASSGIGLALARLMDGQVDHVALSARSADKLQNISASATSLVAMPLDVTDAAAVEEAVSRIEADHGPIDLALLNAGVWHPMAVKDLDLGAMRQSVDVNYMGVVNGVAAVLPGMLARGRGHIAIVASVAGYRGLPQSVAYGPTKAALINLAEVLRSELGPKGIDISIVNPGFVDTPMTSVNKFPMPAIISVDTAAKRLLDGLVARRYEIVFPRRLAYAMKLLRLMPNALFFWLSKMMVGGTMKPRQ